MIPERFWQLWLVLFAVASLLGYFDALGSYASAYHDGTAYLRWNVALSWDLTKWNLWAVLAPFVLWLGQRFPVNRLGWSYRVPVYILAGVGVALVHAILHSFVHFLIIYGVAELGSFPALINFLVTDKYYVLIADYLIGVLVCCLILTGGYALDYHRQARENELKAAQLAAQLAQAQLQALKMQIHPHFLFNALNSISALQLENAEAALEMTARLGDFLRMTLDNAGAQEVSLRREIEFLECYLDVEKVRFGRRLATKIEVAPDVLPCLVPNLILQPLVENAIRHGLAQRTAAGRINVSARRENGWLKIAVADNGTGIEPEKLDKVLTGGLGLSNTRARLERLYGANFRFELQNAEEGGLLATLRLPHNQKKGEEIID